MGKETTSTNQGIGDEGYKGSDLSEIEKIDRREPSVKEAENLENQDLAVIIAGYKGTSDAADVLNTFNSNVIQVFCASIEQLMQTEGIRFVKTYQIKATFELTKRIAAYCEEEHPKSVCKDVTKLLAVHMVLPQEEFRVILLDSKQDLTCFHTVSLGSLDKALVESRDVFRLAITASAASVAMVHNHPSGDFDPSQQDVLLTRELCMCGLIGIEGLDHITEVQDHVRFKESGGCNTEIEMDVIS